MNRLLLTLCLVFVCVVAQQAKKKLNEKPQCFDKLGICRKQNCHRLGYEKMMSRYCQKTCGCNAPIVSNNGTQVEDKPSPITECKDKAWFCPRNKYLCNPKRKSYELMHRLCKATCNICSAASPASSPKYQTTGYTSPSPVRASSESGIDVTNSTDSYNTDSYSTQGYESTDGYSTQGSNTDSYNTGSYSTRGYESTGSYSTQGSNTDSYNTDSYSTQGYNTDDYSTQSYESTDSSYTPGDSTIQPHVYSTVEITPDQPATTDSPDLESSGSTIHSEPSATTEEPEEKQKNKPKNKGKKKKSKGRNPNNGRKNRG